jgi:putative membrane protein
MVMLINDKEKLAVEQKIQQLEKNTDAELVCVLANKSDDYQYIPVVWAAILALVSPLPLWFTPYWHETSYIIMGQFIVFLAVWLVLRQQFLLSLVIPKEVRQWRAANLARRAFLENGLHYTNSRMGVLIFISEAEHYAEIIADQGIAQHIGNEVWQSIINQLTDSIKRKQTHAGILSCLQQCGDLLAKHAPATGEKNELANPLVIIDLD